MIEVGSQGRINMSNTSVRVWSEQVSIPTWEIGRPNPNPMFLEKRVYQGSSGAVYPYPVIDKIADAPSNKTWTAVFLENEVVELMILPELGGRLHRAVDKTNGYRMIYHNQVIKPALVGLTGPWISGGIEFNWPQHHRPTTYSPVDWTCEEGEDGSCTVWCAENERMFRQRGRHGFRLEPGRTSFEVVVRLSNPCEQPGTFLWWANPAVHVHDEYQSVFPADVHAVMDHGKRDVSTFPIATGEYYKQDYSPGTDISRYKHIPVPTSYMAYHSDYNHVGCYDHAEDAGMLHVANHHLVPGKKQWTWGNGEFGQAWDRQLTEEDGPYIELMCGAFTDNQPDFTWLAPGEEKRFTQTFLSYKEIGPASTASRDWVLSMSLSSPQEVTLGLYAVAGGRVHVELWHTPTEPSMGHNAKNLRLPSLTRPIDEHASRQYAHSISLTPGGFWTDVITLPEEVRTSECTVRLLSEDRKRILLRYSPPPAEKPEVPEPATPAPKPESVASNEELWLHGQHVEQYRHATFRPEPYYEEALRRDPGDSRCHLALGRRLGMRGDFRNAEDHLRQAITRLTMRNPNPSDGEAYYQLGLMLRYQSRWEDAEDAFYKATWSEAWKSPACFELARLACRRREWGEALGLIQESLRRNSLHAQAHHLQIRILKELGDGDTAKSLLEDALSEDPLNFRADIEGGGRGTDHQNLLLGLDLSHAGMVDQAGVRFDLAAPSEQMALYFKGWACHCAGNETEASAAFQQASLQVLPFAFPNLLESVPALETALSYHPEDALAAYALGNFLYAHHRPHDAMRQWEVCTRVKPEFPTAWRNLGLARMNVCQDPEGAFAALEQAFSADTSDARVLYEWDQLAKEMASDPADRLKRLETYPELCTSRDDLCVEVLTLLNGAGRFRDALKWIEGRVFHPWEGGEGKVPAAYVRARIGRAGQAEEVGDYTTAKSELEAASHWPENLGEGKLGAATENERWWRLGRVLRKMGDADADACLEKATQGDSTPAGALYYNDQPPENVYFQARALRDLGREEEAESRFLSLITFAEDHQNDEVEIDYFAVSLPDFLVFDVDLSERNLRHCYFLFVLGYDGVGDIDRRDQYLARLLEKVPDHPVRQLINQLPAG